MLVAQDPSYLWMVVTGFIVAFILAFGIGANDVANSFGTSVGSKVLTLKQACVVASIFEIAGAILIGARVSDTVRKGIIDINSFNGTEELAMAGAVSALGGTGAWLLIATFFSLPVSGTHSVVGATMGYALVAHGTSGVNWPKFGLIAASWVVSPIMSGVVSALIFVLIRRFILSKDDSFERGLKFLFLIYGLTLMVNLFSVFYNGSHMLGFDRIPLYGVFILTFGGAGIAALVVHLLIRPFLRKKILTEYDSKLQNHNCIAKFDTNCEGEEKVSLTNNTCEANGCVMSTSSTLEDPSADIPPPTPVTGRRQDEVKLLLETWTQTDNSFLSESSQENGEISIITKDAREKVVDEPKTARLFSFLQILTASFGAFAHGGNDVSNAIGPLISLWLIYETGIIQGKVLIPVWILCYGGVGISVGLWMWGRRVIKTMGEDLTPITPSSGFTIEIGSAFTVLVASNLGIPISTTHCKVGSVVTVGRVRSKGVVDWRLFRNIVFSWIITMPIAGGLSAGMYALLREVV